MLWPRGPALGGAVGALLVALLVSCGPDPKPALVWALVPDEDGTLTTRQVELTTVIDLTTLKGTTTDFVGGAAIKVTDEDILPDTDEARYASLVRNPGLPVRANYLERDGVLWPSDFHTWNLVTAFYNFERAYLFYASIWGKDEPVELQASRVLYWADVSIPRVSSRDNIFYFSLLKSFVILPFERLQEVPLPMNAGVVGHEMAHRVFNEKVLQGEGLHPALLWAAIGKLGAFNLLKSIDEGFADLFAYGVTCREPSGCHSDYLEPSLPDEQVALRDFSRKDLCQTEVDRLESEGSLTWTDSGKAYQLGSIWAAALFQGAMKAGGPSGVVAMQKALLEAEGDTTRGKGLRALVNEGTQRDADAFTPEAVAEAILFHLPETDRLRSQVCSELLTRLALHCPKDGATPCAEIPSCPLDAAADQCGQ